MGKLLRVQNSALGLRMQVALALLLTLVVSVVTVPKTAEAVTAPVGTAATGSAAAASSFTVTMTAPTIGNTVIAVITTRSATINAVTGISQTGVYWNRAASTTGTAGTTTEIWSGTVASTAGTVATINLSSATNAAAVVMQYSGLLLGSVVDKSAVNFATGTAATTGTTATTAQANELWVAGFGLVLNTYTATTPASFNARGNAISGTAARAYFFDRIVTATGAATAASTISTSSNWSGAIVTFRESLLTCTTCHGGASSFPDGTSRNDAGRFPGTHSGHVVASAVACTSCHANQTTTDHSNGTITMAAGVNYAAKGLGASWAVTNTPAFGSCAGITCHGSGLTWGTSTTNATCTKCHGKKVVIANYSAANNWQSAPGYSGTGTDLSGATAETDAQVGAHNAHLTARSNLSLRITCAQCHTVPATAAAAGHTDSPNPAEVPMNGTLARANTSVPSYTAGTSTCINTYCHFGKSIGLYPPKTANASVVWTNTNYLTGAITLTGDCGVCHASPPSSTGTHLGFTTMASCNPCHSHLGTNGVFTDKSLHIDGIVQGAGKCIDCHATTKVRAFGRPGATLSAVKAEFGLAYGHKKSGRLAVTDADCIVCHLEGESASQKPSLTYHKNGNIDLRDPDVQGETAILNLTNTAFTFQRFTTSFTAGTRSSAPAANNIAQVISVKFCLKCHDSNGAVNTFARVPTIGTASMPWGGSTGYAAQTASTINGVPVANGSTDVNTQFATTNSSVHPVLGPRTRDFPTQARMVAPYNSFTRAGTAGTVAAGIVMNCFDCHNNYPTLNYLGRTGLLTLRTNAAHGTSGVAASGGMMRGVFYSTNNTLCSACHSGYTVTNNHGAGSAMATSTGRTDEGFANNCMYCHGSKTSGATTAPARPIAAADFHGSNSRYTGVLWPTINARPVAFIRGWSGTGFHRGRALAGTSGYAAGTAQCGNGTCPTGGAIGDGSTRNYTPGGTY